MALPSIEAQNTAETSIILVMLQYHLLHLSFPDTQLIMNYRLRSSQTLWRNWRRDGGAAGTTTTTSTWDAIAVPRTRGWSFFTALLRKAHGNLLLPGVQDIFNDSFGKLEIQDLPRFSGTITDFEKKPWLMFRDYFWSVNIISIDWFDSWFYFVQRVRNQVNH